MLLYLLTSIICRPYSDVGDNLIEISLRSALFLVSGLALLIAWVCTVANHPLSSLLTVDRSVVGGVV